MRSFTTKTLSYSPMNIIYLYNNTSPDPILQIFDALNLSMSIKLSDIGTAEFDVSVVKKDGSIHEALMDVSYLKKGNPVKIGAFKDWVETIVFEWFISNVSHKALATHIICSDKLLIFEDRRILADVSYNTGLSSILSGIFATINATENTGISTSCSITTVTEKDYSAGTKVIDIIKDLASGGNQFALIWNVLYLEPFIWEDRSVGDDRVEFIYEYTQARSRTIEDFEFLSDIHNIKNAIYAKSSWGGIVSATDAPSITSYKRREEFISVNWDATTETSKYLAEHKDDTVEISIVPISKDYSLANVGDKVWVYIDRGDPGAQYEWSLVVQSKDYIDGDLPQITYTLSTSKIRTPTILEKIKSMADDIYTLKNI